jgi:hypothetical protein
VSRREQRKEKERRQKKITAVFVTKQDELFFLKVRMAF